MPSKNNSKKDNKIITDGQKKIRSCVVQLSRINVIWIWVQWNQRTMNRIKNKLIQERIVGSEKCIDIVWSDLQGRHLEKRWNLPNHLQHHQNAAVCTFQHRLPVASSNKYLLAAITHCLSHNPPICTCCSTQTSLVSSCR